MCVLNHQQISTTGVRDKEGEYVISLPTYSRTVVFAGTKIVYTREQTQYNDKVKIEGPTTAVIQIVVSTPAMPPLQWNVFPNCPNKRTVWAQNVHSSYWVEPVRRHFVRVLEGHFALKQVFLSSTAWSFVMFLHTNVFLPENLHSLRFPS